VCVFHSKLVFRIKGWWEIGCQLITDFLNNWYQSFCFEKMFRVMQKSKRKDLHASLPPFFETVFIYGLKIKTIHLVTQIEGLRWEDQPMHLKPKHIEATNALN
jgi:hypothetical protein